MKPGKIQLILASALFALSLIVHLAMCKWTVENSEHAPPLVTFKDHAVADESKVRETENARKEFDNIHDQIKRLEGTDDKLYFRRLVEDPQFAARVDFLLKLSERWRLKAEEASKQAYGKYGIYARGERDSGLIIGIAIPTMLLLASIVFAVWSFSCRSGKKGTATSDLET